MRIMTYTYDELIPLLPDREDIILSLKRDSSYKFLKIEKARPFDEITNALADSGIPKSGNLFRLHFSDSTYFYYLFPVL